MYIGSRNIKASIPLPTSMDALLLFTTTIWLCIVNVRTDNLEFWQIGVKLCESKCQQRNLCLGIKYEMKYLHCQLLLKEPKEDKTNPEITLRYLNKGQVLNMTACGKGIRILSPRFADKKCVQGEASCLKIEKIKKCIESDPNCAKLGYLSIIKKDLPAFRKLVVDGCDFSVCLFKGMNVKHLAISAPLTFVRFIVSHTIVPIDSQMDSDALMLAARGDGVYMVKFLVGEHCNVSITNGKGFNMLHMAVVVGSSKVVVGSSKVVTYISENDLIDIKVANVEGKTPLNIARMLRTTKNTTLLMTDTQLS